MIRLLLPAALPFALAGCGGGGAAYPSLQPRPLEKRGFAEPTTPVAAAVTDPVLDAQLAGLGKRLDGIEKGFADAAAVAERRAAAASGRPAGSDAWLGAQTALASLDDWRAQASSLATDIEQITIERGATLAPPYPALTALSERANAQAERQGAAIARLQAMLAPA
jgi:hypothetical protein